MTINTPTIRKLMEIAHSAPSADNSQPWRLVWNGNHLSVGYDSERVAGKTFPPESPATLLSMGSVVEILMAVATDWGMDPQLEINEALPSPAGNYASIHFNTIEDKLALPQDIHPASLRHTNRLPYLKQCIPENLGPQLEPLSGAEARVILIKDPGTIRRIADIVQLASEVRFQTQEVHEWLGRSLRFSSRSAAKGDGMDVATLGLPPGGRLFLRLISKWSRMRILNKFGIYKIVAAIDSAPIKAAPGLVAVIAPADAIGTFNAGRLMARSWIKLNTLGLSVHPYYVIADQLARKRANTVPAELASMAQEVDTKSSEPFTLEAGETLHMLFRIGYTKKKPRLALRLPLDDVYRDTTP